MMEALVCHPLGKSNLSKKQASTVQEYQLTVIPIRHYQSPHATLETSTTTWSMFPRSPYHHIFAQDSNTRSLF